MMGVKAATNRRNTGGGTMNNPVIHFEIGSRVHDKAAHFYSELFGWDIHPDDRGYGLIETGADVGIGGGLLQAPHKVAPYVTVYVGVDDLDKYLDKAEELGGKKVVGPTPVGDQGWFALFLDLDGNVIGLFREKI
jgi:uncharacterized protein